MVVKSIAIVGVGWLIVVAYIGHFSMAVADYLLYFHIKLSGRI